MTFLPSRALEIPTPYEKQTNFEMQADDRLSRLILPPEIDPLLLLFRRKPSAAERPLRSGMI